LRSQNLVYGQFFVVCKFGRFLMHLIEKIETNRKFRAPRKQEAHLLVAVQIPSRLNNISNNILRYKSCKNTKFGINRESSCYVLKISNWCVRIKAGGQWAQIWDSWIFSSSAWKFRSIEYRVVPSCLILEIWDLIRIGK
jgi:hypothetical protein